MERPSFDVSVSFPAFLGQRADVYYSVLSCFRVTWSPYVLESAAWRLALHNRLTIRAFHPNSLACLISI